ncbi:FAD-dependent monooxygenase, partial [Wenyingzhuangia sp. 1_MG-2023]|nr:FAD-dependent monooxygenase [Wenyingzhuangia sp. 1_MG-2023]
STSDDEANALMALSDEAFGHALAEAFEQRLGTVTGCSQRAAIPLRQRHARRYWQDGVVLAGDAAHTIHPLAGQGVNLGFKDVEVLAAEVLTAVARGISP